MTSRLELNDPGGWVRVESAELRPGGPRVSRVRSTGHLVELTEDTLATVLLPQSGRLRVRAAERDFGIAAASGFVFLPNSRRTRADRPRSDRIFQALAVTTPYAALRKAVARAAETEAPHLADSLRIPRQGAHLAALSSLLDFIAGQFDTGPAALSDRAARAAAVLIDEVLCGMLIDLGRPEDIRPPLPAAARRVHQAEEIMRARSDEPLSMAQIAEEVGVGLRSLQLAFVEIRAMGPRDVLTRMRMERVRVRLLAAEADDTVTMIALDCGFMHLSRFAGAYRMTFGESPGQTLARARQRRA